MTDPGADRVTPFIVSQSLLLKPRTLVTVDCVRHIDEDKVVLSVGGRMLEELRAYEGE